MTWYHLSCLPYDVHACNRAPFTSRNNSRRSWYRRPHISLCMQDINSQYFRQLLSWTKWVLGCIAVSMTGAHDNATPTSAGAYRALVQTSLMMKEPELKALVYDSVNCWMGPKGHVVEYCVSFKTWLFAPMNDEMKPVDPTIMWREFEEFEPRVQKLYCRSFNPPWNGL